MATLDEIETSLLESRQDVRLGLTDLPDGSGLYGLYGDDEAWSGLGFGPVTNNGLLYIGLTLDGLNRRVIKTHFANRRTPWSIVRRSLAGLLQGELSLEATVASSETHRHFALVRKSDGSLSKWMRAHLQVGVWQSDDLEELQVGEAQALATWMPGLSPYGATAEQQTRIGLARRVLSGEKTTDPASSEASTSKDVLSGPVRTLLDRLAGGDPVIPLAQGKPTWLTAFDEEKIWLETEASRAKGKGAQSISAREFADASTTLVSSGSLTRSDLAGGAQRRSVFVLAALAQLDGVQVELNPTTLTTMGLDHD